MGWFAGMVIFLCCTLIRRTGILPFSSSGDKLHATPHTGSSPRRCGSRSTSISETRKRCASGAGNHIVVSVRALIAIGLMECNKKSSDCIVVCRSASAVGAVSGNGTVDAVSSFTPKGTNAGGITSPTSITGVSEVGSSSGCTPVREADAAT